MPTIPAESLPLAALILSFGGIVWQIMRTRNEDLRLIEDKRKEDREYLERRLERTEVDLAECKTARNLLQGREIELMRRLTALEGKQNGKG